MSNRSRVPSNVPYYHQPTQWARQPYDQYAFPNPEAYDSWSSRSGIAGPSDQGRYFSTAGHYQDGDHASGSSRSYHSGPAPGPPRASLAGTSRFDRDEYYNDGDSHDNHHHYSDDHARTVYKPPFARREIHSRATTPMSSPPPAPPTPSAAFRITLPSKSYLELSQTTTSSANANHKANPAQLADVNFTPKLLVLDLNGTVLYRPKGVTRGGHPRPYIQCFFEYLFLPEPQSEDVEASESIPPSPRPRPWEVFVWSSAKPHNVRTMVEKAFGERWIKGVWDAESLEGRNDRLSQGEGRLLGVWARDKLGLSAVDYGESMYALLSAK